MNILCVAVALGFFVGVVGGCGTSTPSPKSCDFPHKGNGGILNEKGDYIKDAAFAWIDVAKNCFPYVTDPKGSDALNTWINASQIFDIAMQNDDESEAYRLFYVCNDSFKDVAPYISKCDLAMHFLMVYIEFGALLDTKKLDDINEYMIAAFPKFKAKLGC